MPTLLHIRIICFLTQCHFCLLGFRFLHISQWYFLELVSFIRETTTLVQYLLVISYNMPNVSVYREMSCFDCDDIDFDAIHMKTRWLFCSIPCANQYSEDLLSIYIFILYHLNFFILQIRGMQFLPKIFPTLCPWNRMSTILFVAMHFTSS